jgi:hypothetical protein
MTPLSIHEEEDPLLNKKNEIEEQLHGVLIGQNALNHSNNLDDIVIALNIERDNMNIEEPIGEIAVDVQNVIDADPDLHIIPQADLAINDHNESEDDTESEVSSSISIDSSNDSRLEEPTPFEEEVKNNIISFLVKIERLIQYSKTYQIRWT